MTSLYIFIHCVIFTFVYVPEIATQAFDCTTLHSAAFASTDGKKCYWSDLTTRDYDGAKSYCEGLQMQAFDDWILINPRNYLEHSFLREKSIVLHPTQLWWVGQYMRDGDLQFSNVDDPADCPGVFLDWQIDTDQPNGNSDTAMQDEQDCIIFPIIGANANAFQDKACWKPDYGTLCKATATASITCTTLHTDAFQNTDVDPNTCYVTEDALQGTSGNQRTWYSAKAFCEGLSLGGLEWRLPNIYDQVEMDYLRGRNDKLDFGAHTGFYWAGQNDLGEEHVWQYLDQPSNCPPVYLDWLAGQPSSSTQDCVAFTSHQAEGWQDKDCGELYFTMCEITPPCVSFDQEIYPVGEQNGMVTVRVNIMDYKTGTVTANLNVQDVSTTMGDDYTPPATLSVSFNGNNDYVDVDFPVIANDGDEGSESFTITLEEPARSYICQMSTATVYISDETTSFRLQSSQLVTSEGNSIDVTIIRSGVLKNTDRIVLSVIDGSATGSATSSAADFIATSGEVITFLPDETTFVKSLPILSDDVYDDWENFTVSISIDPSSATTSTLETPSMAVIHIRDLTASQLVLSQYEIEANTFSVLETDATFEFVVKRSGDSSKAGSVNIATEDISATAGNDYTAIGPLRLDFDPDETEKRVMIKIVGDEETEPTEFLQITLSNPGPDEVLGPSNQVLFTIYDDDVSYCFDETTRTVPESVGFITMTVRRKGYREEQTSVTLQTISDSATSNSATPGSDYKFSQTVVTFPADAEERQIQVEIVNDEVPEPIESVFIQIIDDSIVAYSATVWIQDDDQAVLDQDCSIVCLNGGICTDVFTCSCPQGFIGDRCETVVGDLCPSVYCQNNGVCVIDADNSRGVCICGEGFEGDRCEIAVLIRQDLCPFTACQNGGTCVQDTANRGLCICEKGYEGDFCQNDVPVAASTQGSSNDVIIGIVFGVVALTILVLLAGLAILVWVRRVRAARAAQAKTTSSFYNTAGQSAYPNSMALYSPYSMANLNVNNGVQSPYSPGSYYNNGYY